MHRTWMDRALDGELDDLDESFAEALSEYREARATGPLDANLAEYVGLTAEEFDDWACVRRTLHQIVEDRRSR